LAAIFIPKKYPFCRSPDVNRMNISKRDVNYLQNPDPVINFFQFTVCKINNL